MIEEANFSWWKNFFHFFASDKTQSKNKSTQMNKQGGNGRGFVCGEQQQWKLAGKKPKRNWIGFWPTLTLSLVSDLQPAASFCRWLFSPCIYWAKLRSGGGFQQIRYQAAESHRETEEPWNMCLLGSGGDALHEEWTPAKGGTDTHTTCKSSHRVWESRLSRSNVDIRYWFEISQKNWYWIMSDFI